MRADAILSGEQLAVGTEWFTSGRLRVRKHIVTYTRTVEVTVRREELVVDVDHVVATSADGSTWAGNYPDGPAIAAPVAQPPHVILLREEVPEISLVTRVYERTRVAGVLVAGYVPVHSSVRREQAVLETTSQSVQLSPDRGVEHE